MAFPKSRMPIKILIPLLVIAMFSVYSFATNVTITTTTTQSQNGVLFNVVGGFTAASNGFQVVYSSGAASTQPMTWSNGATCQTAATAGNWQYSVTLTLAASATPSHTYTVTVSWNRGSGWATMGTLTFTTLGAITPGQTMTFVIDTTLTTFSAPAGIIVTVA